MLARLRALPDEVWIGLLLIWIAAVLQGTLSTSGDLLGRPFEHYDKVLHLGAWFGIAWLGGALARTNEGKLLVWVLASVLGFLVELGQIPLPTRQFEDLDVLADVCGAALGVVLALER